jgi:hypothetical protein
MACQYEYNGRMYTKEELIKQLSDEHFTERGGLNNVFKSIATTKRKKVSELLNDTNLMLKQRYIDAKNMIQAINNDVNLSKEEKNKKKTEYRKIMKDISKTISDLNDADVDKQLDFILDHAMIDAQLVEAMYKNDQITFNDLQFANDVVETWSSLYNVLGIESSTDIKSERVRKKVEDVYGRYQNLNTRARRLAIELVKASTGLKEDEITKMKDTHLLTEWFRELSTTGIALPNKLAYAIKKVNTKINLEHNKNFTEIDKEYDKIKDLEEIKRNGFDIFFKIDKDKDGNETLGLVSRYTKVFTDAKRSNNSMLRKDIERANGDKDLIKKAWQRYNAWNEANTIAFNSLYFLKPYDYTDAQRNDEVAKLRNLGFTKIEIDQIISESQKLYEKFEASKDEYQSDIENEAIKNPSIVPQNVTFEDFVEAKLNEYDDLNNPLKYMEQKFITNEKITAYGGAKFSYLIAAKMVKGVPTKYYDENFSRIMSNPKLHDFYNWWVNFINSSLHWLPQEEIEDLGPDFVPVLADRLAKEYAFTSMKETVAGLGDWFTKAFTVANFDRKVELGAFSKKERRGFEARFINESVPVNERSKDMVLLAKMFSDMALAYKHKNTVKAEIETMVDLVQGAEGTYVMNKKLGKLEKRDKDATSIKSLVDYTVMKSFYGIQGEDEIYKSEKLFYDWKELASLGAWKTETAKEAKKLTDEIKELNKKLDKDDLSEKEREDLEAEVKEKEQKYYSLGGRNFSVTKTLDSAVANTRLLALGFSPFSAVRNLLVGKINNRIHASSRRDFTIKELMWANQTIIESSGKYFSMGSFQTKNTKLIFGLLSDAGVAEGEDGMYLKAMVNKKTTADKFRELIPKAYTWLASGDYHFKAETLLSAMKFEKIKTKDGKEVPFYDALTEDRQYDVEKYGEWNAEANGKMSFDDFYLDRLLKYRQLANKLHGATGKDVFIKAKSNAVGRMLMLFKSWLPETVGVRFDPRHTDALLQRDEEGYYRTFGRLLVDKKFKMVPLVVKALMGSDKLDLEDQLDIANLRKAVKEFQIIITLWSAYAILKAAAPDDDKNKKLYNLLVLRQLHDLNRDLTYYMSPSSAAELQANIFPIFRTAKNYISAVNAVRSYVFDVTDENGQLEYDAERTLLKVTKVLPILSNINRIEYYKKATGL